MKIIEPKDWKASTWTGGETNELFIFPENGDYKTRNFKARLSIATTNKAEKSPFTPLPNIDRFISKLEGELNITHKDKYDISLEQYKIDHFSGDWETYSTGIFKDFNLILQEAEGDLRFKELEGNTAINFPNEATFCFIFIISGRAEINNKTVEANDLIIFKEAEVSVLADEAKIFYGYIIELSIKKI